MMTVKIDEDTALNLLCERVDAWRKPNSTEAKLFYQMYESYIDSGLFDGCEFDPMVIVDNDVVNYCTTIDQTSPDFEKLLKLYDDGERDISCEDFNGGKYSFIEAVSEDRDLILIRW